MLKVVKSQEHRKFHRRVVIRSALLETPRGIMDCDVRNLSPGGARLRVRLPVPVPHGLLLQPVTLVLEKFGRFDGKVVRQTDSEIGVQFLESSEIVDHRLS
jgi:hypothetical protein